MVCIFIFYIFQSVFCLFQCFIDRNRANKGGKKAIILSRIGYITISIILLFCGMGLMSVCIANLVSPFWVDMFHINISLPKNYSNNFRGQTVTKEDKHNTFYSMV